MVSKQAGHEALLETEDLRNEEHTHWTVPFEFDGFFDSFHLHQDVTQFTLDATNPSPVEPWHTRNDQGIFQTSDEIVGGKPPAFVTTVLDPLPLSTDGEQQPKGATRGWFEITDAKRTDLAEATNNLCLVRYTAT